CDNGTEFKNKEMNQFCERKGIKREFSVARTPQQNGVAERKNKTLIEAVRIMLSDSKLPTTFWAEAVNTACYKPALGFMRPFGCPVTILNTIDHLGKFDGKADEGFFVGYSINSKAFRVFNSRTRIVEENLHVQFSENTPNIAGSGPNWLFDIDALTKSMNYKPVVAGNQSNGNAGTKACDNKGKARMETIPGKDYILLPLWTTDPPFSQISKSSPDAGFKPSSDDGKKVDEDSRNSEGIDQEKEDNVNNTNNVNAANTNEVNAVCGKTSIELPDDPNMPPLEDIVYSDDDEDVGAEADMNNLDAFMHVSPIPTTRVHKDHPVEQIIGDLNSAPQTRRMTKNLEEHVEPKKVIQALQDPSWIEAMQDELLQFKLQKVRIFRPFSRDIPSIHDSFPQNCYASPPFYMVNTRTDAELAAAVQAAVDAMLPQIREQVREEYRNVLWLSGNPPPVTIPTWLEPLNKQKPRTFEKAVTPVMLRTGTLTWKDLMMIMDYFKELFFLQFFPRAEQERLKREYHSLRQKGSEKQFCSNFEILPDREDYDTGLIRSDKSKPS
ncbi:ribonuclease H-like domain-containing protein, partial [Tanacetum coccineum]